MFLFLFTFAFVCTVGVFRKAKSWRFFKLILQTTSKTFKLTLLTWSTDYLSFFGIHSVTETVFKETLFVQEN